MCDEICATCVTASVWCCLDIFSGICNDFWTVRHVCLERLCSCASSSGEEANDGEQERLLQNTVPDPQPPMLKGVDAGG
ncbi:hypothetical protein C8Q73DRAFT_644389 [Cubamyces lactineus]|nr:hypothetical protein C8Q73DRAFT_644389 [Cubamyces lactineus]